MKKLTVLLALFASAVIFSACGSGALVLDPSQATDFTDEDGFTDADPVEPADTGDTETPTDTGNTETPTDTGDTETPTDTGDTETPTDTGDTETPTDTGDTETPTDTGDTETPTDTGEPEPDGDSGEPEPDGDTGEPETDGDSGEPEPDGDTGEPEPDGDTGEPEPDGDTGEPEPDGDTGDTTPPTPAQICAENGGNYSGGVCSKIVPCGELPEADTEWNDGETATLTFDFESEEWPAAASPSYSEAGGVCTYKCQAGTRREGNECRNLCSAKFNGTSSYIFLDNDTRSLFDTDMGAEWTIEFWYKQDALPTFSQSTSTAPVLRRGGSSVSSPTFEIYPLGTYTKNYYSKYLYTQADTNMTYTQSLGWNTTTKTENYSVSYSKQVSNLPSYGWIHVALTGKSTVTGNLIKQADITLTLYVNGTKLAENTEDNISTSEVLKLTSLNDGLYLGAHLNGQALYFKGLVSGLRISRSVLYTGNFTPGADLTAGSSTLESWKFDRASIKKLVASEFVPESDIHNIEWSTDCPGN